MAKAVKKAAKSTKAHSAAPSKKHDPYQSIIIQAGVVFIIVAAIVVCSYAFSLYM